jgi:glycosyltransferase involved in cell wall biosynthesis
VIELAYVGDRCCDHSPSSGYDQLCTVFDRAGWLSGRALAAGKEVWHRPLAAEPRTVHILYGDCSGKELFAPVRERFPHATVVATVHLAGSGWEAVTGADALLTVCDAQRRELDGGAVPVHAVPHGVWTRAFRPPRPYAGPRREVLIVGTVRRDWGTARRIVDRLTDAGVAVVLAGSNVADAVLAGHPGVRRCPRLAEAELAALYDGAAALLLPLLDGTASNAVLEAMAAGCPVVCTAVPGLVDEYIGDREDAFAPGDDEAAVARLLRYVADPAARAVRGCVLRERAGKFDWARLAPRYRRAYTESALALRSS